MAGGPDDGWDEELHALNVANANNAAQPAAAPMRTVRCGRDRLTWPPPRSPAGILRVGGPADVTRAGENRAGGAAAVETGPVTTDSSPCP